MTERIIQTALRRQFQNYEYILFNTFMFSWESDFFALSKAGYSIEVEVKISKADFKKDFTKEDKHHLLTNHKEATIIRTKRPFKPYIRNGEAYDPDTYQFRPGDSSFVKFCCPSDHLPNKFYYACPEGLISVDQVPDYAGLIYISESTVKEVKKAPFLHKTQHDFRNQLLSKYLWKHIHDRSEVMMFLGMLENGGHELPAHYTEAINRLRVKFA